MLKFIVAVSVLFCTSICHAGPAPFYVSGKYNFWIGNRLMPEYGDGDANRTVLNEVMVQNRGEEKPLPACFAISERSTVVLIYCGEHSTSELNGAVWASRKDISKTNSNSALYCVKSCRKGVPKVLTVDYD
ncbi:hypothetical protein ACO0LL_25845 [Undibacterium sp. TC4M20W]|uniref:hypothetical protein n=1 Tax=Undibacterium sp. TC4M20W TaxID=3413052 RepID=UPI003BEF6B04